MTWPGGRKGVTGEQLLQLLERRLDNIVYRLGFAPSRNGARQLITHGHIAVNAHKVNVPSFLVNAGDEVEVKEKSKKLTASIRPSRTVNSEACTSGLKWIRMPRRAR